MLLIHCPYCQEDRPEVEFAHAGPAHLPRPTTENAAHDGDFADFFYLRANPKGDYAERWRHVHGCAKFFNAVRNTVTDKFLATYKAGEQPPILPDDNGRTALAPNSNQPATAKIESKGRAKSAAKSKSAAASGKRGPSGAGA